MSRVAYHGREIAIRNRVPVGINFGYGSFSEQEHGISPGLNYMNFTRDRKQQKLDMRAAQGYQRTPFGGCLLRASFKPWHRTIVVDNSDKPVSLLDSGEYDVISLSASAMLTGCIQKRLENRKKVREDEMLYSSDYDFYLSLQGTRATQPFAAMWDGDNGAVVFMRRDWAYGSLGEDILNSIKMGALAICDGRAGLFHDRGFSVVLLDKLYDVTPK